MHSIRSVIYPQRKIKGQVNNKCRTPLVVRSQLCHFKRDSRMCGVGEHTQPYSASRITHFIAARRFFVEASTARYKKGPLSRKIWRFNATTIVAFVVHLTTSARAANVIMYVVRRSKRHTFLCVDLDAFRHQGPVPQIALTATGPESE